MNDLTDEQRAQLERVAEDLAAVNGCSKEQALDAVGRAMRTEVRSLMEPLRTASIGEPPRWWRRPWLWLRQWWVLHRVPAAGG